MKKIFGLLLLLQCFIGTAKAEWIYIGDDIEGDKWYINDNIKRDSYYWLVWSKTIYKTPEKRNAKFVYSNEVLHAVDDKFMKSAFMAGYYFDKKGNVIDSWESSYPDWSFSRPSSVGETIIEATKELLGE